MSSIKDEIIIKTIEELENYKSIIEKEPLQDGDLEYIDLDSDIDEELDCKINDYLDERLVYLIGCSSVPTDLIDDLKKNDGVSTIINMIKSIHSFCQKNKNGIPIEMLDNFVAFVNNESIRFNDDFKGTESNMLINDIIGFRNSAELTDMSFIYEEAIKFFYMDKKGVVFEDTIESLLNLEEKVYAFLVDALYADDAEFCNKYFSEDEGVGSDDSLYVINYIANDFPIVFKKASFLERISAILASNKDITKTKVLIDSFINTEGSLVEKIECVKSLTKLKKNNNIVMRHVVNGYNKRS